MTNGTRSVAGSRPANDLLTSVEVADRTLATLAHLAAVRTGPDGAVLHHALYAALLAGELHLAPADADDRAADPVWSYAERVVNDRARALIEQARQAARAAELAQGDQDETANQHRARTGHSPNFGCCVTDAERAAATQRWETELTQDGAR
ncbi:hypothetical protein HD597_011262 [Nonomuraea thailandensis]|uniref:Uncharacterized protein n=1 Tax=Nonomuraea thailandensis TaxID=1188745 RepID=A0A9X2GUT1_9ACTN|nr:hypothetical protein [Nonomuraea thailandensis]MCP2364242.1 hypothetical protein [Nonomuraea thailandensis]